jgi:hypothetical protein
LLPLRVEFDLPRSGMDATQIELTASAYRFGELRGMPESWIGLQITMIQYHEDVFLPLSGSLVAKRSTNCTVEWIDT